MTRTARIAFLLAVPTIVAAAASTAHGHARLMMPTPRDNRDGYKDMTPPGTGAPCGIARTASQPSANLTAGATYTVAWEETIDHPGCFVIDFAAANDQNFQVIGRKSHVNPPARTGTPASRKYTMAVTLPSAPCTACTLRVRQLMMTNDVTEANLATNCPPTNIPANITYYTCANVVLGGGGASGTGGAAGGAGGTTGTGGGTGGTAAGGRGGTTASGRGGTSVTGSGGQAGSGAAGATGQGGDSGQAGDNGQAGTSGQAGSGASGQAGTTGTGTGQGGSASGQAGTTGQAGNGTSGAAGSTGSGQAGTTGTGGGNEEASGGCNVAGGAPAPLLLLGIALLLFRGSRRRSRS